MTFIYYIFYNLDWSGLLIGCTAEILPYKIRANGLTLMFLCVDLACKSPAPPLGFRRVIDPFPLQSSSTSTSNPRALDALSWKYCTFNCCWLGVELVTVYFFNIETHNRSLEEIVKRFDGARRRCGDREGPASCERGWIRRYGQDDNGKAGGC